MTKPLLKYLVVLSFILNGCTENSQLNKEPIKKNTSVTEEDIYGFMNYLMCEGILNKDHGIEQSAEEDFGYMKSVDSILFQLEINQDNSKEDSIEDHSKLDSSSQQDQGETLLIDTGTIRFHWCAPSRYPKVLASKDSKFIKKQLSDNKNFRWNNDRLGFLSKSNHWYQISVPCFSLDKNHVIILIRSFCPGLCGSGDVYLFTKNGSEWSYETLEGWYH
tara:strand:+ start:1568 stop:2224 length:657 start_codon:yes stop_codon:yes gene_type:complete